MKSLSSRFENLGFFIRENETAYKPYKSNKVFVKKKREIITEL